MSFPRLFTAKILRCRQLSVYQSSSLLSPLAGATFLPHFSLTGDPKASCEVRPVNWGIVKVREKKAFVIERFGKYVKTLTTPGIHFLVPFFDKVAYVHCLKDNRIQIPEFSTVTKDKVSVSISGVLYVKIVDPKLASYAVEHLINDLINLAQTTFVREFGKITLAKTMEEPGTLVDKIVISINDVAKNWGLKCLDYVITDISPSHEARAAMEMQLVAEYKRRARIVESEGEKERQMIRAEAAKEVAVIAAEAAREKVILDAEASKIVGFLSSEAAQLAEVYRAPGEAHRISILSDAIKDCGPEVAHLSVAQSYIESFGDLAKQGNNTLGVSSPSSMVCEALGIYENVPGKSSSKNNKEEVRDE